MNTELKTLAIYGAGGLGREVLGLASAINDKRHLWNDIIFIDDRGSELQSISDTRVFTFDEFRENLTPDETEGVVAVGEPELREILAKKFTDNGYSLAVLIHPSVFVGKNTEIGCGTVICFSAFVSCDVKIGKNVFLQPLANIGHDTVIGDHCIISTFVSIAGHVTVGEKTYIGMSVPVKEGITIGKQSIVGMGSVVLRDIPDDVRALGNPARAMKNNDSKRVFE